MGTSLEKLRIKRGSWESSTLHRDVIVAHEYNMPPSKFWNLSRDDKALMIAFVMVKGDMEAYEEGKRSGPIPSIDNTPKSSRFKKPR